MEKEEILQKIPPGRAWMRARRSATAGGTTRGFYALCILALVLMIYQALAGQVFGDVAARCCSCFPPWAPSPGTGRTGDRFFLGMGIFTGVLCLGCLGWYLWHTLPLLRKDR